MRFNVKSYGASPWASHADNRAALQRAVKACDGSGGGIVVVPSDVAYGYKTTAPQTWPNFQGCSSTVLVKDYGPGCSYIGFPVGYDGQQTREFFFTPQTTSPGQHDGNTKYQAGNWNPGYLINNNANYPSPGEVGRDEMDNRRATFGFMVDGWCTWGVLQTGGVGSGYTNEEMSGFSIQKFSIPGDTIGDYCPYYVDRKTGNISYGIGTQSPGAAHHFGPSFDLGYYCALFENRFRDVSELVLRNKSGLAQDCGIFNTSGTLSLNIRGQGDAVVIDRDTRRVTIAQALQTKRQEVSSSTLDARGGNIFTVNASSGFSLGHSGAVDGQQITLTVRNVGQSPISATLEGFKAAAWGSLAAGFFRSINFYFDGSHFIETSRSADIAI